MIICNSSNDIYTWKTFHYNIPSYYVTGEGYALLPNVDMCNGCSAQQEYGAAFSEQYICGLLNIIQGVH